MRKFGKLASVAMLVLAAISIVGLVGCNQVTSYETNELNLDKPAKSAVSTITSFKLLKADNCAAKADGSYYNPNTDKTNGYLQSDIVGFIDGTNIWLDFTTAGVTKDDLKKYGQYKPAIEIAAKATISPTIDAVQYFGNPYSSESVLKYTVTAENGTTTVYTVADIADLTDVDGYDIYLGDTKADTALEANKQALTVVSGSSITLTAKHPAQDDAKFPYMVKWSVPDNCNYFTIDEKTGVLTAKEKNNNWSNISFYSNIYGSTVPVYAKIYYKDDGNNDIWVKTLTVNAYAINAKPKTPTINLVLPFDKKDFVVSELNAQKTVNLKSYIAYKAEAVMDNSWPVSGGSITWTSSDKTIATVTDGSVKAVNTGTVTITALYKVPAAENYNAVEKSVSVTITFTKH